MSETLSKLKLLVIIILLLSLYLLSGCMGSSAMVMLKKDVLYQDEGFETIVLWRLKIIDRTGDFKNFYPTFRATDPRDLFNKLIN